MNLTDVLTYHQKRYPYMELLDFQKLIYQHTFGPRHIIKEKEKAYHLLKEETILSTCANHELFEDIGNYMTRIYLGSKQTLPLDLLFKLMIMSSNHSYGNFRDYQQNTHILNTFLNTRHLQLQAPIPNNIPLPFSHSLKYKEKYQPHYRILHTYFAYFYPLFISISSIIASNPNPIIVIDGRCGSGKTTLSIVLKELFHADIIHMDDFFLRAQQRTKQRLQEIAGNIDYERFQKEVAMELIPHNHFQYHPYDCHKQSFTTPIDIDTSHPIIIEGAYALHPKIQYHKDLSIFLDIDENQQVARLTKRNPKTIERFTSEWIPKENEYIEVYHIMKKADVIL